MRKPKPEYLELKDKVVFESNALIQTFPHDKFDLSLEEQRVLLYLMAHIKPTDTEFSEIKFSMENFGKLYGIEHDNGNNRKKIKESIKAMADKSVWQKDEFGNDILLRIIEQPTIKKNGTIVLQIGKPMIPYLLNLRKSFTAYEVIFTLRFESRYSLPLYRLLKSVHFDDSKPYKVYYSIEELKKHIGGYKNDTWQQYKTNVIERALKEINAYTDKLITYSIVKESRSVVGVEFTIESKPILEALQVRENTEKYLGFDKDQMCLWD